MALSNAERQRRYRARKKALTVPLRATCAHCGFTFIPQRKTAKYCSDSCRAIHNRQIRHEKALVAKRALDVKWEQALATLDCDRLETALDAFESDYGRNPFLTADGYWLTDARHDTHPDMNVIVLTVGESLEGSEHHLTYGRGYKTAYSGDVVILFSVFDAVRAAPRECYDRAREAIITKGGKSRHVSFSPEPAKCDFSLPSGVSRINVIPARWEYRHLGWIPIDMDEIEVILWRAHEDHRFELDQMVDADYDAVVETVQALYRNALPELTRRTVPVRRNRSKRRKP